MTIVQLHTIVMIKNAGREQTDDKLLAQANMITAGVITRRRAEQGWSLDLLAYPSTLMFAHDSAPTPQFPKGVKFTFRINVTLNTDNHRPSIDLEFSNIVKAIAAKAQYPKWTVESVDDVPFSDTDVKMARTVEITRDGTVERASAADQVGYVPLVMPTQESWEENFSHLFGLEDHIARAKNPIELGIESDWTKRIHTILIGPPGCGKSAVCQAIKKAIGAESVMQFDATSTTQAGAQKELESREELPRVMLVEEIEKAAGDSMQFLLSLMDLNAEVRKVTARGNILRNTKMIVIATANDEAMLKRAAAGATYSRFANRVYFQRPSRDLLYKILQREVESLPNGNLAWIDPALDYAEAVRTTDPREIIAICLCGRDELLTGVYQERMLRTGLPQPTEGEDLTEQAMRKSVESLVVKIQSGEM